MAARTPLIAGNWKMYGRRADLREIAKLVAHMADAKAGVEALICPPAPYLGEAVATARGGGGWSSERWEPGGACNVC